MTKTFLKRLNPYILFPKRLSYPQFQPFIKYITPHLLTCLPSLPTVPRNPHLLTIYIYAILPHFALPRVTLETRLCPACIPEQSYPEVDCPVWRWRRMAGDGRGCVCECRVETRAGEVNKREPVSFYHNFPYND